MYNLKLTNSISTLKYISAIINSQLISYLKTKGSTTATKDDFGQLTLTDVRKIPIKSIPMQSQLNFVSKVDLISNNKTSFNKLLYNLQKYIQSTYYLEKLSKKLQNWFSIEFVDFIKELNKATKKNGNPKLTKTDEMEWMEVFSTRKIEILKLKTAIDQTDDEIDRMVYRLYGLTEDEIRIVEATA